jgi:hypothetical protein
VVAVAAAWTLSAGGGGEGARCVVPEVDVVADLADAIAGVPLDLPGQRFHPQFRDENERGIGKSQPLWTADSKMEMPGSHHPVAVALHHHARVLLHRAVHLCEDDK